MVEDRESKFEEYVVFDEDAYEEACAYDELDAALGDVDLFVDPTDVSKAEELLHAACRQPHTEILPGKLDDGARADRLWRMAGLVVRYFWEKKVFAERISTDTSRKHLTTMLKATKTLVKVLANPELDQIPFLPYLWNRKRLGLRLRGTVLTPDALDESAVSLAHCLRELEDVTQTELTTTVGKRGRPQKAHIDLAAEEFADLWMYLTGRSEFPISVAKVKPGSDDFASAPAQFVRELFRILDPSVPLSEIRRALRKLSPTKAHMGAIRAAEDNPLKQ